MSVFSRYELLRRPTKQTGVQPGILQEALVKGLELHVTLLVPLCAKFNDYLGIDMIIKHQLHFRTK